MSEFKGTMSADQETQQEASLELYEAQLTQVEQAIQAAGESPDLVQLKNDLSELISLTKDGLMQMKKARLLRSLEETEHEISESETVRTQASSSGHDDEYAAFQAALVEDLAQPSTSGNSHSSSTLQSQPNDDSRDSSGVKESDEDESDSDDEDENVDLRGLIGTKCRAPFAHDWGGRHYGNAMIWSIDPISETVESDSHKVRVIFLNPIHSSIIPCKYFLDGNCRFSDEECRRSHGHPVLVSELKPYEEPDHSKICEGCRCLAKSTDDVWYPATVTDVCDDHLVNVRFDAQKQECTVQVEHIVPLDDENDDEKSDNSDNEAGPSSSKIRNDEDSDSDDGLPVYLWKPAQTTEKMGAWEVHTKGIGSKLMAKMGYVTGQGLGPQGDGRAEPVPILLLPQGKSLDKIMELKEMSGNADLFNAMKKLEKRKKVMEKKEAEKEIQKKAKDNWGVFGFINNKLGDKKGHKHKHHHGGHSKRASGAAHSTEKDLRQRSDKEVSIQIFQTAEEIRAVERHLGRLKEQLARNESTDRKMAENVREKIASQEKYLQQLKTSSQTLETHRDRRTAHKKLTIF